MISNNAETPNANANASRPRSEILKSEQANLIASPVNGHAAVLDSGHVAGFDKISDEEDFKSSADNSEPEFVYREGGVRAWLVVIASGYCFGILVGLLNDYSLIYNQMIKDFNGTDNHVLYAGNSFGLIYQRLLIRSELVRCLADQIN